MSRDPVASTTTVAFIGLGKMGFPMAGHLARAGHPVVVHTRTAARAEAWRGAHPGRIAATSAAAATGADIVCLCLPRDEDVRAVATEVMPAMAARAVLVDHSTASAALARELAAAAGARGLAFLDAPVAGGQPGAERGALSVMVGGDAAAVARAEPVFRCYAGTVTHMGPAGAGQLAKMVNQVAIAGIVASLAEALAFAARAGLDAERLLPALATGAARSFWMEYRARSTVDRVFEPGFTVDLMRKDLALCRAEGEALGARLPALSVLDDLLAELLGRGLGDRDIAAVYELMAPD